MLRNDDRVGTGDPLIRQDRTGRRVLVLILVLLVVAGVVVGFVLYTNTQGDNDAGDSTTPTLSSTLPPATTATTATPAVAPAVTTPALSCGEYQGVVCQGYFTDEAGITTDPQQIEDAIADLIEAHGNPVAIVVVTDSRGQTPADFAVELANSWGVGDPVRSNGLAVLVSIEERRTEVVTQDEVDVPGDEVAEAAREYFANGDFQGGLLAIVEALDGVLSGS
jgi:hypothetical protein